MKTILLILGLFSLSGYVHSTRLRKATQLPMNVIIKNTLDTHNLFRTKHKAPPLVVDNEINKIAQSFANTLAETGKMYHSTSAYLGLKLGENIYKCWGCQPNGKDFTTSWYNEVSKYDFAKGTYISGTGHFTQVVWKSTKRIGVGIAKGKDGAFIVVANYYPPGNFIGQFAANVLK